MPDQAVAALNDVDWANNPGLATSLRNSVANSQLTEICIAGNVSVAINGSSLAKYLLYIIIATN